MNKIKIILAIAALFLILNVYSQEEIIPVSFKYNHLSWNVPRIELPKLDHQQLIDEDQVDRLQGEPLRVGVMQNLYYNMNTCGKVDVLPDGGKLWRLSLQSPGARSVDAHITNINIPDGACFYIYDVNRNAVVEKITRKEVTENNAYFTDGVPGDEIIIEYYEPMNVDFSGDFDIAQVGHIYRASPFAKGYHADSEGDCHIDVSCDEGEGWSDQINSVVFLKMSTSAAVYFCSGAMVNNVRSDGTPYILSADHCAVPGATYRFYFQYHADACGSNIGGPGFSTVGATIVASGGFSSSSDFMLMEITGTINSNVLANLYLSGWDVSGATPTAGACIHHPGGDFKKISIPQYVTAGTGVYARYWKTTWYGLTNNKGVTEGGSSGSPLFDGNHRIVGQLFGGESYCETPQKPDYYGKLSYSWNNNNTSKDSRKLKSWLDPDNTGIKVINGAYMKQLVGIKESQVKNTIKTYPNPSNGNVTVDLGDRVGTVKCHVFDIVGKTVYTSEFQVSDKNTLDLSFLDNGIYVIEIKDGQSVQTSKLIISK
ncbi:MAG: T9SS type A sorting domain-containing protein [Bacteroidales bacterium]|jgi:hypothetical protein|nr:T9SS type A sorting domain-containing protein [Bacteroidales bacterium]